MPSKHYQPPLPPPTMGILTKHLPPIQKNAELPIQNQISLKMLEKSPHSKKDLVRNKQQPSTEKSRLEARIAELKEEIELHRWLNQTQQMEFDMLWEKITYEETAYELAQRPLAFLHPLAGLEALILAYRNSTYKAEGLASAIRIGKLNPEIDALMTGDEWTLGSRERSWAFLTACNPMSKPIGEAENKRRNAQFKHRIRHIPFRLGLGEDANTGWAEESFLVLGLRLNEAKNYAHSLEQQAFLYGAEGKPCELYVRFAEGMPYHRV